MNRTILAAAALLLSIPGPARADILTLRTGESVEGKVLAATRTEIRFETKVHNIRTTVTYRRSEVTDIKYAPLPDDFWDSERTPASDEREPETAPEPGVEEAGAEEDDDAPDRPTGRRVRVDPSSQFVVVPVEGGIGEEVVAHGVRNALMQARARGAGHVVFTVDSPGGYVYEAMQILDALKEFDDDLTYHCVIEAGAISAASVFAAGADYIYVRPDARLGGAVAYSSNNSTGAAEVDAKMNSIWSAGVASRAESKGHNGDAFRAMIVMASELWQSDADGSFAPRSRGGDTQIDGPSTVLTISAAQMVKGNMATMLTVPIAEMGGLTGVEDWTEMRAIGQRAMVMAARERADMQRRYDLALQEIEKAEVEFERVHPGKGEYKVYMNEYRRWTMHPESMNEWQARTDAAVSACNTMLRAFKELAGINSKAEKTGAQHLLTPTEFGHDRYTQIENDKAKLRDERNRPPVAEMVKNSSSQTPPRRAP